MPTIQDNTAVQRSTTSDQGSNKMPKFDAKSHFFLEDEVFTQTAAKAFGVLSSTEFRTTSLISVSTKKVISICAGQIFIQPQTGAETSKVNVVLKPYKQPINGLSIKYFIYRGLPKSEFLDANNEILSATAPGVSGFITYIRNEFNNFYAQDTNNTPPQFLGKFIGYPDANAPANEAQQITDLIDLFFYKVSQTFDNETGDITNPKRAFELPLIPVGTHLATVTGEIGLDIVLNHGDYYIENDSNPFKLDLKFARLAEHKLNVATITDAYQKKVLREAATQFIDPAAYYGLHANGGSIYTFGQAQPKKTAQEIYTLITPFATKNNIYIYIQSNRQRSYNFYGNYKISDTNTNNIKIGTTEANLAETTFETNEWPIKVFNTAPLPGSTQQSIALQFTTDRKQNTSLYGLLANIGSSNQEGFVDTQHLVKPPEANNVVSYLTKPVILKSPVANNANVGSFVQLIYLGKEIVLTKPGVDDGDPATPIPIIEYTTKYMDEVFYLTDTTSFLAVDKVFHVHSFKPVFYTQKEIDKNRGRVVSFTQRTQNTIAISETENLTLFTYLSIVESEQSNHSNIRRSVSSNKEATGYQTQSVDGLHKLPYLPSNEYAELLTFSDSVTLINGLKLKTKDRSLPTTIILGISETENTRIKNLLANKLNSKIYFRDLLETPEDTFISVEKTKYKAYSLEVVLESSQGAIEIVSPAEEIRVYSIDGLVFFSQVYSKFIIEKVSLTPSEKIIKLIPNE
jgi:hypothetical protein